MEFLGESNEKHEIPEGIAFEAGLISYVKFEDGRIVHDFVVDNEYLSRLERAIKVTAAIPLWKIEGETNG